MHMLLMLTSAFSSVFVSLLLPLLLPPRWKHKEADAFAVDADTHISQIIPAAAAQVELQGRG
jgi:hypothetical protein